jgi:hypothetical protein
MSLRAIETNIPLPVTVLFHRLVRDVFRAILSKPETHRAEFWRIRKGCGPGIRKFLLSNFI